MKRILIYYSSFALSTLGGLVGVYFLTRYVSEYNYGLLSVSVGLATLMQCIVRDAFGLSVFRYIDKLDEVTKYIRKNVFRLLIGPLVFIGIAFSCIVEEGMSGLFPVILFSALLALLFIFESFFLGLKKTGVYSIHINLFQWGRLVFALLFYQFISGQFAALIYGYVAGAALTLIFDILIFRVFRNKIEKDVEKDVDTASPLAIGKHIKNLLYGSFLGWAILFFDRVLVMVVQGEEESGVYFALFQVGFMPFYLVYYSTFNLVLPRIFSEGSRLSIGSVNKKILLISLGIFGAGVGVFLMLWFLEPYIKYLFGEEFRTSTHLLPYISLYALLFSAVNFVYVYFVSSEKSRALIFIKSIHFALLLSATSVAIFSGIDHFVYTLVGFYLFWFLAILIYVRCVRRTESKMLGTVDGIGQNGV